MRNTTAILLPTSSLATAQPSRCLRLAATACTALLLLGAAGIALGHGDVTPQEVDTQGLPDLGEAPLMENPFRAGGEYHDEYHDRAVEVGRRGYAGNCAVCHGIEAMSGGLTPDLRQLEEWDDEYYLQRAMYGTDRGMPAFEENLDQTAIWAIKTYIESVTSR
ncbi:cytochrome c-550 PedF [Halomonas campisalis]|uniref:Cytochrome c-550 PedF n=1 Tax=Billgrantia campisalis TaxID=74661 RepID=A0ABS9P9M7_9GAMM|nr:cytochrome c-550 PedF [Halomonas campisalis]MCG6658184.1 cytochrome c-550 PedF [Halomonas campisalis]MDR5862852.1 cytochrome c-550 PedF [Halomonas campisalis]